MSKISQYAAITDVQDDDVLPVVDVHDQSMASSGTTKKIALSQMPFDAAGAAAGAQAAAEAASVSKAGDTMNGKLAPRVVTLTDGATITISASTGNDFRVTIAGNRTIAAPSSPSDGQQMTLTVTQDGTGGRTLTWDEVFRWGAAGEPSLSSAAGAADIYGFKYYAAPGVWRFAGAAPGF